MENYIVINGVRHDLMKQNDGSCLECSLKEYCTGARVPCAIFAGGSWWAMSDYYFVLHSNY